MNAIVAQLANENIQEVLAAFAKANKVGKAKVMAFVEELVSQIEVPTVERVIERVITTNGKPAGKPVSQESMKAREEIQKMAEEGNEEPFTVKELALKLEVEPVTCSNNLKYLEKLGVVKVVGKKPKAAGERGRAETLWSFVKETSVEA